MIKHINHQNVTTTPFVAAKARVLSNIQNADTVILEPNAYAAGTNVSLDYVDYNSGDPVINRECDIALEQQDIDSLGYEEGITGSANFNSASDARNTDGTYKSLVYTTTKNAFYNSYRNPTEIFGVEHIDFPLSKTLRNLSDSFRMFTIPRLIFGDKIQPKSVRFYDTLQDDNVEIFDDGYQNLIAGYNLFSKVQEVRTWPSGAGAQNWINPGTASCDCITIDNLPITVSLHQTASLYTSFASASISNFALTEGSGSTSFPSLYAAFYSGSTQNIPHNDYANIRVGYLFGSVGNTQFTDKPVLGPVAFQAGTVFNTVVSGTVPGETASLVSIGFYSGSLFDTVVWSSGSNDSGSITSVSFYSGSVFNTLITSNVPSESGSITHVGFYSGSVFYMVITASIADYAGITNVGFYSASVSGPNPP